MTRKNSAFVSAVAIALSMAGCGYEGAQSLPLPGAIGGSDTYQVTVVIDDATNLVPKETCRANDVQIGSVQSVKLGKDLKARVVCAIKKSAQLPANTVGRLARTSLLGEPYIALDPPQGQQPHGALKPNTVLPASSTQADPNTEQVLGALSAVLNGGNLGRIADITSELNQTIQGHGGDIRKLLDELTTLTGHLNVHRGDITHALDSLNHLSATVAKQRATISSALDAVPAGLRVLNRQRPKLTATLQQLSTLSSVAVPLIERSKANTVADLKHLRPVLDQLGKNGTEIASALELATDFPFPRNANSVIKGNWGGMFGQIHINADTLNELLRQELASLQQPTNGAPSEPGRPGTSPPMGWPLPGDPHNSNIPSQPLLGGLLNDRPMLDLGGLLSGGAR